RHQLPGLPPQPTDGLTHIISFPLRTRANKQKDQEGNMARTITSLLLAACLLGAALPARAYTYQFTSTGFVTRWPTNTITVAFSESLFNPTAFGTTNIKPGTDVVQASRNALRRWSLAANVQFIETRAPLTDVSP